MLIYLAFFTLSTKGEISIPSLLSQAWAFYFYCFERPLFVFLNFNKLWSSCILEGACNCEIFEGFVISLIKSKSAFAD